MTRQVTPGVCARRLLDDARDVPVAWRPGPACRGGRVTSRAPAATQALEAFRDGRLGELHVGVSTWYPGPFVRTRSATARASRSPPITAPVVHEEECLFLERSPGLRLPDLEQLHLEDEGRVRGDHALPAPRAPYPSSGGIVSFRFPPTLHREHPLVPALDDLSLPTAKRNGSPRSTRAVELRSVREPARVVDAGGLPGLWRGARPGLLSTYRRPLGSRPPFRGWPAGSDRRGLRPPRTLSTPGSRGRFRFSRASRSMHLYPSSRTRQAGAGWRSADAVGAETSSTPLLLFSLVLVPARSGRRTSTS